MHFLSRFSCAFAALVLAAAPVLGGEAFRVILPKEERAVAQLLDRPSRADYAGELRDILAEITKEHGVSILVDEQAIVDAGLSSDVLVDLRRYSFEDPDLAEVLAALFDPADLGYVVEDDRLRIVPAEVAASKNVVRAYDVTGMVGPDATAEIISQAVQSIVMATVDQNDYVMTVPFRNRLIVIGNRKGHAAVERALEIMSDDASE